MSDGEIPGKSDWRPNLLRPNARRTDSIREEDEADTALEVQTRLSNDSSLDEDHVKSPLHSEHQQPMRPPNTGRQTPQGNVSAQESTDGETGDEEAAKEARQGSVIEIVTQKAKLALPLRRGKDNRDQDARARAITPTLPVAVNKDKKLPTPLVIRSHNSAPSGRSSPMPREELLRNASFHMDMLAPTAAKAGSLRRSSSEGLAKVSDLEAPKVGAVKRSQKIVQFAEADLPTTGAGKESKRKPSMSSIKEGVEESAVASEIPGGASDPPAAPTASSSGDGDGDGRGPSTASAVRATSGPKTNVASKTTPKPRRERKPPTYEPPMPEAEQDQDIEPAPPSGMYWSKAPCYGYDHNALRAHTATLVGSSIFVFGGCDARACFNDLYVLDADCMSWTAPDCTGDGPPVLRAMTATAVGKKIVIFGGGDGPAYYNDVYVLDTVKLRFSRPKISGSQPSRRRAHTACLYKHGIYVFGGGDGAKALNDIWRLDVSDTSKMTWRLISSLSKSSGRPTARGYHTANMVGSKLIIFGGSDGLECFRDVWVFDVETQIWRAVEIKLSFPRLSHTATVIGSYLFVIGGHDGIEYSSDVLLLNLVTMQWDKRRVYGTPPSGRGYHGTVLHDSRLFVIGGFDGTIVFDDTYVLELAVNAYYSQISHFTIDV
ncbi:MAG: hypothetical protein M1826_002601 [Phylliscum demangeonii]|nr:MAG: hypothetical protein M1826_002601 [Phylliscum demangeonii]